MHVVGSRAYALDSLAGFEECIGTAAAGFQVHTPAVHCCMTVMQPRTSLTWCDANACALQTCVFHVDKLVSCLCIWHSCCCCCHQGDHHHQRASAGIDQLCRLLLLLVCLLGGGAWAPSRVCWCGTCKRGSYSTSCISHALHYSPQGLQQLAAVANLLQRSHLVTEPHDSTHGDKRMALMV
jgi:hypothetical protein